MTQVLQFTLQQVAEELKLSENVITRLSQYFRIPHNYYNSPTGQVRVLLYNPNEIEILRQIQALLIEGKSLTQVKQMLLEGVIAVPVSLESFEDVVEDWDDELGEEAWDEPLDDADIEEETSDDALMEYDQGEQMKQHLAEATFKQYLHENAPQKTPLKNLAQALNAIQEPQIPIKPVKNTKAATPPKPVRVKAAQEAVKATQSASLEASAHSWMSADLRQRAMEIQRELLLKNR